MNLSFILIDSHRTKSPSTRSLFGTSTDSFSALCCWNDGIQLVFWKCSEFDRFLDWVARTTCAAKAKRTSSCDSVTSVSYILRKQTRGQGWRKPTRGQVQPWTLLVECIILLSLTIVGSNVYSVLISWRSLKQHSKCTDMNGSSGLIYTSPNANTLRPKAASHMRKYLIGGLVCSAASISTGGFFPPIPHLVVGVLGQNTWHLEDVRPCGAATPSSLAHDIRQSLTVVWFTLATSVSLLLLCCQCRKMGDTYPKDLGDHGDC
ncbi:hypothetical protein KP509_13G003800 [Ceratopteris richardii]|uniref:Uncharacterized protein n=1 Tax=Ceratopteris richardii TaxID=49495 RepID=A0A8T2TCW7_CERRI|nr:hypothetical protein KP509_13G003800 [Ceratopteris richardii]